MPVSAIVRVDPEGARSITGAVEASIFALLGLLIAFTFSGAGDRFEARRELITEEANSIGTAWLRIDLLADADQSALREQFRQLSRCAPDATTPNCPTNPRPNRICGTPIESSAPSGRKRSPQRRVAYPGRCKC